MSSENVPKTTPKSEIDEDLPQLKDAAPKPDALTAPADKKAGLGLTISVVIVTLLLVVYLLTQR